MTNTHYSINCHPLWDIAGVDGLQVMQSLFGDRVDRIAPFQSLEAELDRTPCSILRLCEGNFRVRWQGEAAILKSRLDTVITTKQVWVKQFSWLVSLVLPEAIDPALLAQVAIPKPPFRLQSLALHCALPARIEGIAVLVWWHPLQGKNVLELHASEQQLSQVKSLLMEVFA